MATDPGGDARRMDGTPRPDADPALDPTAVRAQAALTSSSGAIWLIVGGLFAAIAISVLIPLSTLPDGDVALAAAIVVGVLYLGMLATRLGVPAGRRRLGMLATGMLLIAAISVVAAAIVMVGSWNAAR